MTLTRQEQRENERRIAEIDAELASIQRDSALRGDNLTARWDELFKERIALGQVAADRDEPIASPRYLVLLTVAISVAGGLVFHLRLGNPAWAGMWFFLGTATRIFLIARRNDDSITGGPAHSDMRSPS